jgi:hypothetical protein
MAIVTGVSSGIEYERPLPTSRTVCICDKENSMLTRSLFTFSALALFSASATAQDIPAKLAPPQERPLVGKYAAIYGSSSL